MHHFFHHAVDSQLTASPAYFELLLRQFQEDKASGMLHVQLSPDHSLLALFVNGQQAVSLRLDPSGVSPLAPGRLQQTWSAGELAVRSLAAPSPAVRAIWQALAWGPAECQAVEARRFEAYLGECRRQKRSGLLYIDTPGADGFLTLWAGDVYNAETVFDSSRGFEDASPLPRRAAEAPAEAWQVAFYACRLESPPGQQFILRLALADWMRQALTHYQNMVGQNLVMNANYQFNTLARKRFLDIRTVGTTLIDRQFFPEVAQWVDAYRLLLPALLDHMSQVIGAGLVRRLVDGARAGLNPAQAAAMQSAGLGADSDLWKR